MRNATLDTSFVPPSERFDLFRAGIGVLHDVERIDDGSTFSARLDSWLIGSMFVTAGHQGASRVLRDRVRANRDGFEHITLMHVRAGRVVGDVGGAIDCGPGDTIITDAARPLAVDCTHTHNIGVRLPRMMLQEAGVAGDLHGIVLRGAPGRLISDHFEALARRAETFDSSDAALIEQVTATLVRTCLRWSQSGKAPAAPPHDDRARAERFIEQRLADFSLDIPTVARGAGVSRSALFRAFPGGVERFITARRLDHAHARLRITDPSVSVARIGHEAGFLDASHFRSAFRRRFGVTPASMQRGSYTFHDPALSQTYKRWSVAVSSPRGVDVVID